MQAAEGLKSTGTKATVYWIPSHVGIDGNEKADILAASQSSSNEPIYRIYNKLSVNEQCAQLKIHLQTKFLKTINPI
jgi:ribonuclease HI